MGSVRGGGGEVEGLNAVVFVVCVGGGGVFVGLGEGVGWRGERCCVDACACFVGSVSSAWHAHVHHTYTRDTKTPRAPTREQPHDLLPPQYLLQGAHIPCVAPPQEMHPRRVPLGPAANLEGVEVGEAEDHHLQIYVGTWFMGELWGVVLSMYVTHPTHTYIYTHNLSTPCGLAARAGTAGTHGRWRPSHSASAARLAASGPLAPRVAPGAPAGGSRYRWWRAVVSRNGRVMYVSCVCVYMGATTGR